MSSCHLYYPPVLGPFQCTFSMQKGPKTGGYICDNMRLIQLKVNMNE